MIKVLGKGEAYFETGTEGVYWAVCDNQKDGYDGLYLIKDGDNLIIYDKKDTEKIVWQGIINLEYETHMCTSSFNSDYKQQAILGLWVHGLQKTENQEEWAKYFIEAYPMFLEQKSEFEILKYTDREKERIDNNAKIIKKRETNQGAHGILRQKLSMTEATERAKVGARIYLSWKYHMPADCPYPHYWRNNNKEVNIFLNKKDLLNLRETIDDILGDL